MFTLTLVTPEKKMVTDMEIEEVLVPAYRGQLDILPGHAPLMTELGIGELTFQGVTQSEPLSVIRGFAEVLPDRVTVLAETAELAAEIDLERAEAAKARAEKRLAAGDPNIDWDRAGVALQRALIRIQVARKHRGVPLNSR